MEGEWRPRPLEEVTEPGGGFAFKNDDWPADGRVAAANEPVLKSAVA
jgi:hypothetical protein